MGRRAARLAIWAVGWPAVAGAASEVPRSDEWFPSHVKAPTRITVRVYNFSRARGRTVDEAITEAARVFRRAGVPLEWVDCRTGEARSRCATVDGPLDVVVRVLATALPEASGRALGMTSHADSGAVAAVFYDRVLAASAPGVFPAQILGRAMAHEVGHALVPDGRHLDRGLMRAALSADDFRIGCSSCLLISEEMVRAIQRGIQRRVNVSGMRSGVVLPAADGWTWGVHSR